jgi:hypothetical protein
MTGFLRGLFGGNRNTEKNSQQPIDSSRQPPNNSKSFYLGADDAKTLGNVDFMRTAKSVRRTYARTVGSPEAKEVIKQISSLVGKTFSEQKGGQSSSSVTPPSSSSSAPPPQNNGAERRQSSDSGLDKFRAMARDIRKKS